MPTPFYHLSVAQDLLAHPGLSAQVRTFLNENRAGFLLGKTAPDVQVISGQRREDTHFFTLPLHELTPAWERMLETYPALAEVHALPRQQAAFLAGYICHLQADQFWALEIFNPGFGLDQKWSNFRRRLYLHNVLRAYLDQQDLPNLAADTGRQLEKTRITRWLPFVEDDHLYAWRDDLSSQLRPGVSVRTVEVFAERQGLPPADFYQLLNSEELLEGEIFAHLPRWKLTRYRENLIVENIKLLETYLNGL